jgi:uncharacterized protein YlzI (FlbEa/FlbD family)
MLGLHKLNNTWDLDCTIIVNVQVKCEVVVIDEQLPMLNGLLYVRASQINELVQRAIGYVRTVATVLLTQNTVQ